MIVVYCTENDMTYISKKMPDGRWIQVGFTQDEVIQIASAKARVKS